MTCLNCGRKLSNPKSVELGYGPVCFGKISGEPEKEAETESERKESGSGSDIPGQTSIAEFLRSLEQKRREET